MRRFEQNDEFGYVLRVEARDVILTNDISDGQEVTVFISLAEALDLYEDVRAELDEYVSTKKAYAREFQTRGTVGGWAPPCEDCDGTGVGGHHGSCPVCGGSGRKA